MEPSVAKSSKDPLVSLFVYRLQMSFVSVNEALERVLKGELQGAIKETIQGANQEALQSVLSRLFQGALK